MVVATRGRTAERLILCRKPAPPLLYVELVFFAWFFVMPKTSRAIDPMLSFVLALISRNAVVPIDASIFWPVYGSLRRNNLHDMVKLPACKAP